MAHECPDCGLVCYCGNDIDDILLCDTEEEIFCTHCLNAGFDDDYDDDYEEF